VELLVRQPNGSWPSGPVVLLAAGDDAALLASAASARHSASSIGRWTPLAAWVRGVRGTPPRRPRRPPGHRRGPRRFWPKSKTRKVITVTN
jgi:hypothetical protein